MGCAITTTELVNKVYMFCEAYSGVQLFPYQQQFAKRIIRSVLDNDGDEITALFSRQCVAEGQLVTLANGKRKKIEDIRVGDEVLAYDKTDFTPNRVSDAYYTGQKEVYELKLKDGHKIICTANHRFLRWATKLYTPLFDFEYGDLIAYRNLDGCCRYSEIEHIKPLGKKHTYDIEVESSENFICNGIIVHNSGKSETVSTICGGLALLLPVLANTPMFCTDKRLEGFKNGFMIGCFAPTLRQAQIVFNRMKKRIGSKYSQDILDEFGITFDVANGQNVILSNGSLISSQSASEGSNIEGDSYMLIIVDEAQDVGNFKYSKSISPMGAFYNATKILIGTATTFKGFFYESINRNEEDYKNGSGRRNHFQYNYEVVMKYNPSYAKYIAGEKKRLGEHSDEFQMSYNLKWILERGMFIDTKTFNSLLDDSAGLILEDMKHSHIIGIDLGKKNDSTVVTAVEVDWENPVLVETSKELDVPDYTVYPVILKNWLEIQGDNWNEQYDMIMDFISYYKTDKVVIDGTGVGDAIYDRVRANLDCEVVPFVFSKQGKSDLYKHFNSEIRGGRISVPGDQLTKDTREFEKFSQQMLDLEKGYSGQCLVVAHPNVAGAHDDYPDSLALAVWGAKGDPVSKPVTENQRFYEKGTHRFTNKRNKFTARRR